MTSKVEPNSATTRPGRFRGPGDRTNLWQQAPRLASALPANIREATLVYPLEPAMWTPIREACLACMQSEPALELGRWLPGLHELDDLMLVDASGLPDGVGPIPARTFHALLESLIGTGRATTWAQLATLSLRDLRQLPGIGSTSVGQLLEVVVDVGICCVVPRKRVSPTGAPSDPLPQVALPPTLDPSPAPPPNVEDAVVQLLTPLTSPMATIAMWAFSEHGAGRIERALALAASEDAPSDVRESTELLRAASVPTIDVPAIGSLIDALLHSLPDVRRTVFEARVLQPPEGTLEVVGERLGVTRERVRQIETAAVNSVHAILTAKKYRWLRWRAHTVKQRLGRLVPDGHIYTREVLTEALGSDTSDRHEAFLMWAAGPYELRGGMWIADGRRGSVVEAELHRAFTREGLTDEEFNELLSTTGIPQVFAEEIIAWLPRTYRALNRWFLGRPTITDLSVLALAERGSPATVAEILDASGLDRALRSVTNHIQADERIVRVSKDTYALREWGLTEYSGIADAIERAIEERGGLASVPELMQEIAAAFDVSPMSVKAYADAPMFVLEGDTVRMRRPEEPFRARDQLTSRRRTYRYGQTLVIVLDIDREVMRGSGRPLVADVVQALDVTPGTQRRFQGDGFDVVVSWPKTGWLGGSVGSLRSAVAAADAVIGQSLRLSFDAQSGTVRAKAIDPVHLANVSPLVALRLLTGAPGTTTDDVLQQLDDAFGQPLAGVEATLRARGDNEVADIVNAATHRA